MKPEMMETEGQGQSQGRAPGRLVIQFLQQHKGGATMSEIIRYLKTPHDEPEDLARMVENLLENGTAMGFLERKGSHYENWSAREAGCRRRRRSRRRRRRSCRRKQRRRSCRRPRKRSGCRRRKPACCCKRPSKCK